MRNNNSTRRAQIRVDNPGLAVAVEMVESIIYKLLGDGGKLVSMTFWLVLKLTYFNLAGISGKNRSTESSVQRFLHPIGVAG